MLSDPNFPEDLAIVASTRKSIKLAASRAAAAEGGQTASSATTVEGDDDEEDAAQDVASYGIAGR